LKLTLECSEKPHLLHASCGRAPHAHLIETDGLFGLYPDSFRDLERFFTLQREWCLGEVERLKALEIEAGGSGDLSRYLSHKDLNLAALRLESDSSAAPRGWVVQMHPLSGDVTVTAVKALPRGGGAAVGSGARRGALPTPPTGNPDPAPAPSAATRSRDGSMASSGTATPTPHPLPALAKSRAHRVRTEALQDALARESRGPGLKRMMALTVLALQGNRCTSVLGVQRDTQYAPKGLGQTASEPLLAPGGRPLSLLSGYQALMALEQSEFQALYTRTLSGLVFDSETQDQGTAQLTVQLEREVELDRQACFTLDADYLGSFTKDELWELAQGLPTTHRVRKTQKKSEMVAELLTLAPKLRALNWMPLHFWPGGVAGPSHPSLPTPEPTNSPTQGLDREDEREEDFQARDESDTPEEEEGEFVGSEPYPAKPLQPLPASFASSGAGWPLTSARVIGS